MIRKILTGLWVIICLYGNTQCIQNSQHVNMVCVNNGTYENNGKFIGEWETFHNQIYSSQNIHLGSIKKDEKSYESYIVYNHDYKIIGYINSDGKLLDSNYQVINKIQQNKIYNSNFSVIGYYSNLNYIEVSLYIFFFSEL